MNTAAAKAVITIAALAIIVARILWPQLTIDSITLGLLVVAILPWLSELIKSAELPGGWKVEFQDLAKAGSKIVSESTVGSGNASVDASITHHSPEDANLALVGLRIEIENRIRQLASISGVSSTRSLMKVFSELRKRGILEEPSASGLHELIIAGNQAAHGAAVDPAAAKWAIEHGPRILGVLDRAVQQVAKDQLGAT